MNFVLLHSIMQSSKRAKQRLLGSLQPPLATDLRLTKKDRTGFIMILVIVILLIAFVLMI